jgi:hypothetical protein
MLLLRWHCMGPWCLCQSEAHVPDNICLRTNSLTCQCWHEGGAAEAERSSFVAETVARLAEVLRECGFKAGLRDSASMAADAADEVVAAKRAERRAQLREATRRLIVAGLLASACFTGHISHLFPSACPSLFLFPSWTICYCQLYFKRKTAMVF